MRNTFFIKQQFIKNSLTSLMAFLLLLAACSAFGQTSTGLGTVTDASGEPVIGTNILEKGTTNGAFPSSTVNSLSACLRAPL
jgi:hypothetical protein